MAAKYLYVERVEDIQDSRHTSIKGLLYLRRILPNVCNEKHLMVTLDNPVPINLLIEDIAKMYQKESNKDIRIIEDPFLDGEHVKYVTFEVEELLNIPPRMKELIGEGENKRFIQKYLSQVEDKTGVPVIPIKQGFLYRTMQIPLEKFYAPVFSVMFNRDICAQKSSSIENIYLEGLPMPDVSTILLGGPANKIEKIKKLIKENMDKDRSLSAREEIPTRPKCTAYKSND